MGVTMNVSQVKSESSIAIALRAARKQTPLDFSGAMVPNKSPIDKAAALAAVQRSCSEILAWINVCKSTKFSDEQIKEWEDKGVCCIDLGDRKYNKDEIHEGSATEWVINHYALPITPGLTKLVGVINRNNQTGYLKSFRNAVPYIMRELYELERANADWWSVKVLKEAAEVVTAFVQVEDDEVVQRADLPAPVAELVAQLGDANKPLTLGQYASNLWSLGDDPLVIIEKLEFWEKGLKRLGKARQRAKAQVVQAIAKGQLPTFYAGRFPGVLLEKRDHFFTKEVLHAHKFAIRVIVEEDGHATISTNKLDCSALAKFLEKREPGRWHHNVQMGALINGGPQYTENPSTEIPSRVLVELVKSLLGPKKN